MSPDGKWLLAGNWTHRDVSLVNLRLGREVKRIVVGGNPRGIAFTPDSSKVYLSAESGQKILVYTFATGTLRTLIPLLPGEPRHMVIDKAGKYLYLSLNKGGGVVKIDIAQKRVVDRVSTGKNPRTIVLAPDGRSLYVVNYESQTVVKVRTRDMVVIQRLTTRGVHPVGIDYDAKTRTVWVACYRGTIERFADRYARVPGGRPRHGQRPPRPSPEAAGRQARRAGRRSGDEPPTRRLSTGSRLRDQRRRQVGEHVARARSRSRPASRCRRSGRRSPCSVSSSMPAPEARLPADAHHRRRHRSRRRPARCPGTAGGRSASSSAPAGGPVADGVDAQPPVGGLLGRLERFRRRRCSPRR